MERIELTLMWKMQRRRQVESEMSSQSWDGDYGAAKSISLKVTEGAEDTVETAYKVTA